MTFSRLSVYYMTLGYCYSCNGHWGKSPSPCSVPPFHSTFARFNRKVNKRSLHCLSLRVLIRVFLAGAVRTRTAITGPDGAEGKRGAGFPAHMSKWTWNSPRHIPHRTDLISASHMQRCNVPKCPILFPQADLFPCIHLAVTTVGKWIL